jgi:chromosome segregation protein
MLHFSHAKNPETKDQRTSCLPQHVEVSLAPCSIHCTFVLSGRPSITSLVIKILMYLQSLELIGFKSFAHKTVLNFHPGVTAIVGPNGCGKSNLLDAVRWVLGEQSAKALRGGEMADVIFSGTESKQPVGMAEVSLTFADCEKELGTEYNEVRITRRVFRDGVSEYLLNKSACRLKDIQMLFMDTGIGRTAYSIMEQGKLDLILSSRPEDRRAIFEEAAGITKYKAQKKEALRKLEYTDANLVRLADIMKEVKRQIGSLQRQAGKARRYKTLLDDLRTLDTHFSRKSLDEIHLAITAAEKEIEQLRNLQRSLEEQVESQEFGVTEQRRAVEALEGQISQGRQGTQELKNQADTASNRIEFNEERIRESGGLSARYQAEIAAAEEKILVQQSQLEETDRQLGEILETLQADEGQLQEQQQQVIQCRSQRQDVERSVQDFQRQLQQRESQVAELRGDISSILNQREAGETRLQLLQRELIQAGATQSQLGTLVSQTRNELELAQTRVQNCRDDLYDSEHKLAGTEKELQQIDGDLSANQRTLAERESKLEVLRTLNEEGAGLGAGTQAVLRGLDDPQTYRAAILGALANFIEVKSEFIPAIEAALGQHLQTILVNDPAIVESIAADLAEKKVGRAALVSGMILPKQGPVQLQSLPDRALAWALDRIKPSPEVSPLVHRLLDNVALAPDLPTAFEIKRNAPDLAVVTTVGEYISRDGVVFAGRNGDNGNSILQRKIQIQQLEEQSLGIRSILQSLEKEKARYLAQAASNRQTARENGDSLQSAQVNASTLQGQLALLDRELREAEGKTKSLNWERDNVQQQLNAATGKVESLELELSNSSRQLGELQTHLVTAIAEVDSLRGDEETLVQLLNELKLRVATGRQQQENLQRQRQPIAVRITELTDLIVSRRGDISNYTTRMEQLDAENLALHSKIEQLKAEQAEAEADVARLLQERAQSITSLDAVELNLRHLRKQLSDCQEIRGQHEVKSTQLNLRLEHICEHVAHRYQVDLTSFQPDWYAFQVSVREQRKRLEKPPAETESPHSMAATASDPVLDWDFVQTAIAEMTERLDAMGPVNLEAIQEYDELEERQKFLEEQHSDLVRSKNELLDVINKINATTKELFSDTFEQVRKNFQEMFTELFGGGKANLLLVDDTDPLESGIEIIARPPGKQLQSISLLSGGERTMTAVSLLFAIYMVKPSPFCVLDEMDAPLDESNISRFIKIVNRFVHQSQFVVITHNKRTIAKADVLYGVTMEEHGISKLVGVRLTPRDKSAAETDLIGTAQSSPSIAESFGKHSNLHSETGK